MAGLNTGIYRPLERSYPVPQTIIPNRWSGEHNCLVGPFSCREVAEHFANTQVDFGQYESFSERVLFIRGDWYVEIKEVAISHEA
ncbi:MAG: hypothetical protein JSV66_18250 [Trueperaceae bacterium]|nr:MAG: hypothetical protein JSV66_18250 [Trueperaceae bacterium]